MGFSLDPESPMSEAVRRVACAELEAAYAAVASPPDRHRGVHDARKCLKRLRSLLLLIRPGLPEPVFLSLSERLRTIARGLAPARDAHALLDAIDKLGSDAEGPRDATPIPALRSWLHRRRQAAERSLESRTASDAMRGLFALRPAMGGLAVYPDDFHPIAKGLRELLSRRTQSLRPCLCQRQRRGFPRVAKNLAAPLAPYAAAHAVLALRALGEGRGGANLVATPRRRP